MRTLTRGIALIGLQVFLVCCTLFVLTFRGTNVLTIKPTLLQNLPVSGNWNQLYDNLLGRDGSNVTSKTIDYKNRPRLLFSINSGRVGSGYLAKLLSAAQVSLTFHENNPSNSHWILRNASMMGLEATRNIRMNKLRAIKGYLSMLSPYSPGPFLMYAETSHLFYKTFMDLIMEELLPDYHITVVILSRYLPLVLASHDESGVWKNACGDSLSPQEFANWYYNPSQSRLSITYPQPPPLCTDDGLEIAMAYLVDVEAWKRKFKREYARHPNVNIVEVRLEELNTENGVFDFFDRIGIPESEVVSQAKSTIKTKVLGKKINSNEYKNKDIDNNKSNQGNTQTSISEPTSSFVKPTNTTKTTFQQKQKPTTIKTTSVKKGGNVNSNTKKKTSATSIQSKTASGVTSINKKANTPSTPSQPRINSTPNKTTKLRTKTKTKPRKKKTKTAINTQTNKTKNNQATPPTKTNKGGKNTRVQKDLESLSLVEMVSNVLEKRGLSQTKSETAKTSTVQEGVNSNPRKHVVQTVKNNTRNSNKSGTKQRDTPKTKTGSNKRKKSKTSRKKTSQPKSEAPKLNTVDQKDSPVVVVVESPTTGSQVNNDASFFGDRPSQYDSCKETFDKDIIRYEKLLEDWISTRYKKQDILVPSMIPYKCLKK